MCWRGGGGGEMPSQGRQEDSQRERRGGTLVFDGLGTILHAVWPQNIQGTRRETGRIQVSSVQCISIAKVMLTYINNGNSNILLGPLTDSDRRFRTSASSATPPFSLYNSRPKRVTSRTHLILIAKSRIAGSRLYDMSR